jgi:3-dehydro-L-gulonate 2-dehydrogenase
MRVSFDEMKSEFKRAFLACGVSEERAEVLARVHTETSRDGVYSHGANRVPRFVEYVKKGWVDVKANPTLVREFGSIAVYDGNFGPGITNALFCTDRAMELAKKNGIGLVGLRNTSHWLRGGTYGHYAAQKGFVASLWTNTNANTPPWGGKDPRIGNNPFVMACPDEDGPLVLDMAMSLYSYGKLEVTRQKGANLPFPGGYDKNGKLTSVPAEIEESHRLLPTGYWKGSSMSFMLDVLAAILSQGNSTAGLETVGRGDCGGASQVFLLIDPTALCAKDHAQDIIEKAKAWIKTSARDEGGHSIQYPGEGTAKARAENTAQGIFVDDAVWAAIKAL